MLFGPLALRGVVVALAFGFKGLIAMVHSPLIPFLTTMLLACSVWADPPEGFIRESIGPSFENPVGILERFDDRKVVWERGGRVWLLDADGARPDAPWIDLSPEVGGWRDHGLLGCALHPSFEQTGWVYLLYVVDRHHLLHAGTPDYDPTANDYFSATIGRLVRYTARSEDGFQTIDPESRLVLIGERIDAGLPVLGQSHAVGSLVFGQDGTLLASMGDSASHLAMDVGGDMPSMYTKEALAEGILAADEDVGAFRAQSIDSLCGKILRIDPTSGDGVPGNPFYEDDAPRSARSRVWSLGFRNPYRMNLVPDSGSHDPMDADPGVLLVGDVGWFQREEVTVIDRPGLNGGWPIYEGLRAVPYYPASGTLHPGAPNPLAGSGSCEATFRFTDLLREDTLEVDPVFLNPCQASQAEDAVIQGAMVRNMLVGHFGDGYVDFQNPNGDSITWSIDIPRSGTWELGFRYALGNPLSTQQPIRLLVDDEPVSDSIPFPGTGSWTEWEILPWTIEFEGGAHLVTLETVGSSAPHIDCLFIREVGGEALLEVPEEIPVFVHCRPLYDSWHSTKRAMVPTFVQGVASTAEIGTPGSSVSGAPFLQLAVIAGPYMDAVDPDGNPGDWPSEWAGVFFADYVNRWIRVGTLDDEHRLTGVRVFDTGLGALTFLGMSRDRSKLYAIDWYGEIAQYRWAPGGNQAPIARFSRSTDHGPSPLLVTLDASETRDPNSEDEAGLTYTWTFSNGDKPLTGKVVEHEFLAASDAPERVDVILTVTDPQGAADIVSGVVSLNNTPPSVAITSPLDGSLYAMDGPTMLELRAAVFDAEHGPEALSYEWMEVLHHNTHTHDEPPILEEEAAVKITPLGCGIETFWYRFQLVVTDAAGLSTVVSSQIYPQCETTPCGPDFNGDGFVNGADLSQLLAAWGMSDPDIDLDGNGDVDGMDLSVLLSLWGPCAP